MIIAKGHEDVDETPCRETAAAIAQEISSCGDYINFYDILNLDLSLPLDPVIKDIRSIFASMCYFTDLLTFDNPFNIEDAIECMNDGTYGDARIVIGKRNIDITGIESQWCNYKQFTSFILYLPRIMSNIGRWATPRMYEKDGYSISWYYCPTYRISTEYRKSLDDLVARTGALFRLSNYGGVPFWYTFLSFFVLSYLRQKEIMDKISNPGGLVDGFVSFFQKGVTIKDESVRARVYQILSMTSYIGFKEE